MNKIIQVGLAGFGAAAKVMHAPFLATNKNYAVAAVLERHKNDSQQLFPHAKIVQSIETLLSLEEIDLIIITTPNDTHFSYASQALSAGKNVVLEKPFTITSKEALELIALSKEKNKVLSVFHNRRYVPDFVTIKEIINNNLLGTLHEFEAHYDRYRPQAKPHAWREENLPGSGILYDLGPHIIDQALVVFGLPKRLQQTFVCSGLMREQQIFSLTLDYGYMRALLHSGMLVREPGPRYMLHGSMGSFLKYGEEPQEALLKQGILPLANDWGMENESLFGLLHTEINGEIIKKKYPSRQASFGDYYKHLYETLVYNAPLREMPEHGYNTIKTY